MESPDTLFQVLNQLRCDGYTKDLNRPDLNPLWHDPDAYRIDGTYRFEGATNPDDEAILYALSSIKYGIKGVLVNGYGPSADPIIAAIAQKLQKGPLMKEVGTGIQNGSV
jgi:hypothetical protein